MHLERQMGFFNSLSQLAICFPSAAVSIVPLVNRANFREEHGAGRAGR